MGLGAVILRDLGTGPDGPIIVSHWFASRGDEVWEGDRLVEVLAGPATFDIPAPATGRLAEIRGQEDDQVASGAVLCFGARAAPAPAVVRGRPLVRSAESRGCPTRPSRPLRAGARQISPDPCDPCRRAAGPSLPF